MSGVINVSGYNGTINNLTVLGTLTTGGFAPSGNLSVSGNLTVTGTISSTGNGKYLAYGSSSQVTSIGVNKVNFENNITNTFNNLTVSNNNTFTYTGSGTVYLLITYNVMIHNAVSGNIYAAYIAPSFSSVSFGQNSLTMASTVNCYLTGSIMLPFTNGQSFSISLYTPNAVSISIDNTGGASTISITQIP
jgi:hypothetical protein